MQRSEAKGRGESRPGAKPSTERWTSLRISQSAFYRFQYVTVTLLVALAVFHYVYADIFGEDVIKRFTQVFDPGRENSIPTSFSILNLLISSILLFVIYRHSKSCGESIAVYWLILSIIFFFLSIDEGAGLHERTDRLQEFTGVLIPVVETHSWLPYGALFALTVFLFFVPFLRQLDPRTAALFLISGAIFLLGALGLEFVGAWMQHAEIATREDLLYRIRRVGEEGCEMYGIALFNCTLFARVVAKKVVLTLMGRP